MIETERLILRKYTMDEQERNGKELRQIAKQVLD